MLLGTYAKMFVLAVTAIFSISIGWGLSDMIKVKPLAAKVKEKDAEIYVLKEAYESNRVAVEDLKTSLSRQKAITDKLIKAKEKLLRDCLDVCAINSGGPYENPTNDSLLSRLNSVFVQP